MGLGAKWKPVTAFDIASRRWWDVWLDTDPNPEMEPNEDKRKIKEERLACFNVTKYPPFKAPLRDV